MKSVGLLSLNEVNFELIQEYLHKCPGQYPNIEYLLKQGFVKTSSESEYDLLEPWIQWPSIQTCKVYDDHKVFRLGDILKYRGEQIYEIIEDLGIKVGAVSPMNAVNKLKNPAYFIPDPWTKTSCSGSFLIQRLYRAIIQAVGDNASDKISLSSKIFILLGLISYSRFKVYPLYLSVIKNAKSIPGSKALILDILLNEVHNALFKSNKPGFTQLFLNSFAHIQHHYMLSSDTEFINPELKEKLRANGKLTRDPFPQALKVYDWIVGDFILTLDHEVIVATGLSQVPYDRLKYYYRLKDHASFLREILKVEFESVNALMTRDFVVNFSSEERAQEAEKLLKSVKIYGSDETVFGEIQNRGTSIFVTLTYSDHLDDKVKIVSSEVIKPCVLQDHVVFVAVKNGMHNAAGYLVTTKHEFKKDFTDQAHVKQIGATICNYFKGQVKGSDVQVAN